MIRALLGAAAVFFAVNAQAQDLAKAEKLAKIRTRFDVEFLTVMTARHRAGWLRCNGSRRRNVGEHTHEGRSSGYREP